MKPRTLLRAPTVAALAATLAAALALAGCASSHYAPDTPPERSMEASAALVAASYEAVDALLEGQRLAPVATPGGGPGILVPTVADINNLERSSAFGRLVAELMSSRLAQRGVPVRELKLRSNLYVSRSEGEFLLSRELKEISSSQNADLVLVGTYADGGGSVFVSLKLVRASDSRVSYAYNYAVRKTSAIGGLLKQPAESAR